MPKRSLKRRNPLGSSKSSDAGKAFRSLIYYLTKRDHSEHELKQKLNPRYTAEAIQTAIQQAHHYNYIKDAALLAEQLDTALNRRDKSQRQINATLKKRGLPMQPLDPERELAKCREVFAKKFGREKKPPLSTPERVKAVRYLTYRGFDFETINKTLKNIKSDEL